VTGLVSDSAEHQLIRESVTKIAAKYGPDYYLADGLTRKSTDSLITERSDSHELIRTRSGPGNAVHRLDSDRFGGRKKRRVKNNIPWVPPPLPYRFIHESAT
jgi:hypothetical protein